VNETGDLFKSLVWDWMVKAALGRLFAAAPFLAWGPIGWIVTAVVDRYTGELYDLLHEFIDFKVIAFRNVELRDAFITAELKLKGIAQSYGIYSPEYKVAHEAERQDFARFVRIAH
jgi:hypothetical protein